VNALRLLCCSATEKRENIDDGVETDVAELTEYIHCTLAADEVFTHVIFVCICCI